MTGGRGANAVAAGDFNNDGHLDLAVTNGKSNNVGILLGDGSGSFALHGTLATGRQGRHPVAASVADLNRDGIVDIVTANRSSRTVCVFLGTDEANFGAVTTFATGRTPKSVTLSDKQLQEVTRHPPLAGFDSSKAPIRWQLQQPVEMRSEWLNLAHCPAKCPASRLCYDCFSTMMSGRFCRSAVSRKTVDSLSRPAKYDVFCLRVVGLNDLEMWRIESR